MTLFPGYPIEKEDRQYLASTSTDPLQMKSLRAIPERVDPRRSKLADKGWMQMENQLSQGSCQGQSLTECAEYCYTIATNTVMQFSRQFAYLVSQMKDRIQGDRGSTLSGGTKAAKEVGLCREAIAPYQRTYPGWGWVTEEMKLDAKDYKLRSHTRMRSSDQIKQFIGSGAGIVQIGIAWNNSMNPNSQGCITRFSSSSGGGHAVVFAGYVPDSDVGTSSGAGYWMLLKNSWGKRWGKEGYAYVAPQAIDQMLKHRFTVMYGRSDMEVPNIRDIPYDFTKPNKGIRV